MKLFKTIFILTSLLLTTSALAQDYEEGKLNATIEKTFSIEQDGVVVPYKVRVMENRQYGFKFDESDQGQVNQDRLTTPAKVTKLVVIDKNIDGEYDHYIVLKYRKSVTDTFKLIPTEKGFAVKVDNRQMQYIYDKGIYFIDNKDQDFFTVDEFESLGK